MCHQNPAPYLPLETPFHKNVFFIRPRTGQIPGAVRFILALLPRKVNLLPARFFPLKKLDPQSAP